MQWLDRFVFDFFKKRSNDDICDIFVAEAHLHNVPLNPAYDLPSPGYLQTEWEHTYAAVLLPNSIHKYFIASGRLYTAGYMHAKALPYGFDIWEGDGPNLAEWFYHTLFPGQFEPAQPPNLDFTFELENLLNGEMLADADDFNFELENLLNGEMLADADAGVVGAANADAGVVGAANAEVVNIVENHIAQDQQLNGDDNAGHDLDGVWHVTKILSNSDVSRRAARLRWFQGRLMEQAIVAPLTNSFPHFLPNVGMYINVFLPQSGQTFLIRFQRTGNNFFFRDGWLQLLDDFPLQAGTNVGIRWSPDHNWMEFARL